LWGHIADVITHVKY